MDLVFIAIICSGNEKLKIVIVGGIGSIFDKQKQGTPNIE
jgi:hypothetical protein